MRTTLTPEQVALVLQIHVNTVRKLARSGERRGSKVSTGWRFTEQDITAYLEHNRPTVGVNGAAP